MQIERPTSRGLVIVALLVLASLIGCGGATGGAHATDNDIAKAGLTAALDAWQAGQKPSVLNIEGTEIHVEDSVWKRGIKLSAFEILDAVADGGPLRFQVKLTTHRPAKTQTVEYFVTGTSPVWIFRDIDYQRPAGM
jgi:hypothetical protein